MEKRDYSLWNWACSTVFNTGLSTLCFVLLLSGCAAIQPGGEIQTGEGPKEILGFGEAKAAPSMTHYEVAGGTKDVKSFGKKSLGAIGDTVGNRITFAFGATKDGNGNVQGQMFLRDHTLNLTISSDVTRLVPHPKHRAPVGVKAHGLNYAVRMESSTTSVVVNGEPQPGWFLRNGPAFDGDKDTICFGLFDPEFQKVYQWNAFLSAGDVKTK